MDITSGRQLQILARDRRLTLGLSQEAVAGRAGTSRKWVSEFERGKASVDLALVLRLLGALGLRLQLTFPPAGPGVGAGLVLVPDVDLEALGDGPGS